MRINFCDPSFQTKNVWKGTISSWEGASSCWVIVTPEEDWATGSLNMLQLVYEQHKQEMVFFFFFCFGGVHKGGEWIWEDWEGI